MEVDDWFVGSLAIRDLDGDGSLVDVGSGRSLVEGGGFFDDSLVEVGEGGLGVFVLNSLASFQK